MTKTKETLDDIITNSGLKLEAIATKMDISVNYLWRIRKNPRKIDVDFAEKLAEVLSVELDRLIEAIRQ